MKKKKDEEQSDLTQSGGGEEDEQQWGGEWGSAGERQSALALSFRRPQSPLAFDLCTTISTGASDSPLSFLFSLMWSEYVNVISDNCEVYVRLRVWVINWVHMKMCGVLYPLVLLLLLLLFLCNSVLLLLLFKHVVFNIKKWKLRNATTIFSQKILSNRLLITNIGE